MKHFSHLFALWGGCLLVGFGLMAEPLISSGASWHYRKGIAEASSPDPSAWHQTAFDDRGWNDGTTPFASEVTPTGTVLNDMPGIYSTLFLRRSVTVTNAAGLTGLTLKLMVDDGCIVWLNGHEVFRTNAPAGEPAFTSTASAPMPEPISEIIVPATVLLPHLAEGANVVAVQLFNGAGEDAADFLFDATLDEERDFTPPTVVATDPVADAVVARLNLVEVEFSEPVSGVDAADLLLNGAAATELTAVASDRYLFTFAAAGNGTATLAWRTDHGITDRSGRANPFAGGQWQVTVDPKAVFQFVEITEFMADNDKTLNDEDGDDSDWIELHNSGPDPVALLDCGLTDVAADKFQWRFPDVTLEPGAYLLVFASGKNRTNPAARLHTNFKLSPEGEYLGLVAPDGTVVSEFAPVFPAQRTDVSYGRVPGSSALTGFFLKPTPGSLNGVSGAGFAPEVAFSVPGGSFTQAFPLTLIAPGATNAVIRYTLDGSLPTNTSPAYSVPLNITATTVVRARAFAPGLLPGQPHSEAYVLLGADAQAFRSDLPLLVMFPHGTIGTSRNTAVTYHLHEPINGITRLSDPPTFRSRGGAKMRGSSTQDYPKSSYGVEWWDEFNEDDNRGILGMPAESEWVLYAPNNFDPPLIHNPFMHQLSRDLGQYSPRTRFVEVFQVRSGAMGTNNTFYRGIYVLEEKISLSPDRVDSPKLQPEHRLAPEVTGGYLMKIDRLDPGDTGLSAGGASIAMLDPKERELKSPAWAAQRTYLTTYLNNFQKALNAANWRDPLLGYQAYFDVPHGVDYHILEVLSGNVDSIVLSSYFYKPRDGKLRYGVHWDFDRALGSTDGRDANARMWNTGPFFSAPWWSRLCADSNFWQRWVDRYQELRGAELSLAHMHGLIDRLGGQVTNAQPRERARWRVALRGGTYNSELNHMKNWLSNRVSFLDRQMAQPPVFSRNGGLVSPGFQLALTFAPTNTLSGTNTASAAIYYTLDGSDPRGNTNSLAPTALLYGGPLTISTNLRVTARVRDLGKRQVGGPATTTPWSAPVSFVFTVTPPALTVTELGFHPAVAAGDTNSPGDYEFVELRNVSAQNVTLAGYRFVNGIDFDFTNSPLAQLAPGGRLLLVRNADAFAQRYPDAGAVAGQFTGALDNSGERLTLLGPLGEVVFDFRYDPTTAPLADGLGFTLVSRDDATPPDQLGDPANWRLSALSGGSPGATDLPLNPPPTVWVNEVLARPAAGGEPQIELHNPGATVADLGGWWLTDDRENPYRYRLPAGTKVPAGGFLVLKQSQFNPAGSGGFKLRGNADEGVWLFSANAAGDLTGWRHGVDFGAQEAGVSLGRWVTSDGRERWGSQRPPTLGTANISPLPGGVVFSQIRYAPTGGVSPDNGDSEFLELLNPTGQSMPLFDPVNPSNTWRLRGGADFDFPAGVTLAAGERIVLLPFNPPADGPLTAILQARFGLPAARLFGPFVGTLDNAGDAVRLARPDAPVVDPEDGSVRVPYVTVDQVSYQTAPPWPVPADDAGVLKRRLPATFGDEPASWLATLATPGAPDGDDDGLPDTFEVSAQLNSASALGDDGALGDPDGDGLNNRDEFVAGTDPRSALSNLSVQVTLGADGKPAFNLSGQPGRFYTLQSISALSGGTWLNVDRKPSPAGGGEVRLADPAAPVTARFYRVTVP